MTFRASAVLTQSQALLQITQMASYVKATSQNANVQLLGNVTPDQINQLVDNLRSAVAQMTTASAVPGIATYAQAQYADASYDVVAEFTTMVNLINAVISWVVTNFPKDAQGFAQSYKINGDGSRTVTTFTPAQTAGLTTALNAVIAQIT